MPAPPRCGTSLPTARTSASRNPAFWKPTVRYVPAIQSTSPRPAAEGPSSWRAANRGRSDDLEAQPALPLMGQDPDLHPDPRGRAHTPESHRRPPGTADSLLKAPRRRSVPGQVHRSCQDPLGDTRPGLLRTTRYAAAQHIAAAEAADRDLHAEHAAASKGSARRAVPRTETHVSGACHGRGHRPLPVAQCPGQDGEGSRAMPQPPP